MNPFDTDTSSALAKHFLEQMFREGAVFRDQPGVVVDMGMPVRRARSPKLADPRPPEPPEVKSPTADPRVHHVVAWRHAGPLETTAHASRKIALDHARGLSWAVFWKWMVMDGHDMVQRGTIAPPAEFSPDQVAMVIGT